MINNSQFVETDEGCNCLVCQYVDLAKKLGPEEARRVLREKQIPEPKIKLLSNQNE